MNYNLNSSDSKLLKEYSKHLNNCGGLGCPDCDFILDVCGYCSFCNEIDFKSNLDYDHVTGDYYCENCIDHMPEKSGPEYKSCESCHERINKYEEELRDNLTMEDYCIHCGEEQEFNDPSIHTTCMSCKDRGFKGDMIKNYLLRPGFTCQECIDKNTVKNKWELLDI